MYLSICRSVDLSTYLPTYLPTYLSVLHTAQGAVQRRQAQLRVSCSPSEQVAADIKSGGYTLQERPSGH